MSKSVALLTARRGTVALSLICFAISYIALADLALIAGQGLVAYLWPVMIDGTIVVGTVAVFGRADWHAWSLLVAAAAVSVIGNGIHAWVTEGTWIAVGVALTPPIFLWWVTHLTVRLGRIEPGGSAVDETVDPRTEALRLIALDDGLSMREIGRRVGTSDRNVRRWRDELSSAQIEPPSLVGVST